MICEIYYATYAEQNYDVKGTQDLVSLALSYEYVLGAKAFEYKDSVVVAVLTAPFYLKSERDKAKLQLKNDLASLANRKVIVTFDMSVFRKIRENMSVGEIEKLYAYANRDNY